MPTQVLVANCFVETTEPYDLVLTEESLIAQAQGTDALLLDPVTPTSDECIPLEAFDRDIWELAYHWFRPGATDDTVINGISVGDIAGYEVATAVIEPFIRGVRLARAFKAQSPLADRIIGEAEFSIAVAGGAPQRYAEYETIVLESFCAALGLKPRVRLRPHDDRNDALIAKYSASRDVSFLPPSQESLSWWRRAAFSVLDRLSLTGRRASVLIVEYHPTRALAEQLVRYERKDLRIVRLFPASTRELLRTLLSGNAAWPGPRPQEDAPRGRPGDSEWPRDVRLEFGGVQAPKTVETALRRILRSYCHFVASESRAVDAFLNRANIAAVIVPFEVSPVARLLLHCANRMGVPTFSTSDGFPLHQTSVMELGKPVASRYLAWSRHCAAGREGYVTGNPEFERITPSGTAAPGHDAFHHILLNPLAPGGTLGRRHVEDVFSTFISGISQSGSATATVTCRPHPSDLSETYAQEQEIGVTVSREGPPEEALRKADLLVTVPSTMLFQAIIAGIAVVLVKPWDSSICAGVPWEGDEWLAARTATSAADLAELVNNPLLLREPPPRGWLEHYVGPVDSSATTRIYEAITATVDANTQGKRWTSDTPIHPSGTS